VAGSNDIVAGDPPASAGEPPTGAGPAIDVAAGEPGASAAPTVASTRTVEIVVSVLLLLFAGLMAFDNWRAGMGWAPDGPKAGYFPFYLSVILGAASLYGLVEAIWKRTAAGKSFVDREQLRRVLQVFVPTVVFCLLTQLLGIYVASLLLIAAFMRFVGRIAWWKSIATSFLFAAAIFVTFDLAFDVIMPKGPVEALIGR
jgi:putative tricarboxylic transport membrane protein